MARGNHGSPAISSLPKVSFQKIEDDFIPYSRVSDNKSRSYGYNDASEFRRPESYIRHIEPLEIDLEKQVEYDMDEQDKQWLDAVNVERKKAQLNAVSYEAFEIIMDRLEKEWFNLTKNIPKSEFALPSEDSTCAICDDSEGENSNAIVFCDGCNLAVHQDCYGVPYIPEGQWLCRKCTVSPENPVSCILCPNEGGAFKQTVHGEWVHLLCAIWVPETRVANDVFMEPITGVERISKQRWKLKCSVCDIREGACIQCAKTSCFLAFHATCARRERLLLPMKSAQGAEPVTLTCYCDRHLPKEQQDSRATALAADKAQEENNPVHNTKLSKSARAYAKTYKPGPPLVPAIIVNRISTYIMKIGIRKQIEFLLMVCRYWSLKREARRGAPLLKRLHLEPWTVNVGGKIQTDEEKQMKLDQLKRLAKDVKQIRDLALWARKRESRKLEQVRKIKEILDISVFHYEKHLRDAFKRIVAHDRSEYFKYPVSRVDVPDYFDIVKKPMCWTNIDAKLNRHEYWDTQVFKDDIFLVIDNALLYNRQDNPFRKTALRIQAVATPILNELPRMPVTSSNSNLGNAQPDTTTTMSPIGDLEPPLELLGLLVSKEALDNEIDIVLNGSPLACLFRYELVQEKPPPPPPPAPPPKPPKPKRDRRAEYLKKKQDREAAAAAAAAAALEAVELEQKLDVPPGVRVTRTRRAAAAAAAALEPVTRPPDDNALELENQLPDDLVSDSMVEISSSGTAKRIGNKRRVSATMPDVLPLVDNVDNQKSFKMFNEGWIFPPDQRRGGRAPVGRPVASITSQQRKRIRTDPGPSRLSVVSTVDSENQTLQTPPIHLTNDNSMEIDLQKLEQPPSPAPAPAPVPVTDVQWSQPAPAPHTTIPPVNLIQMANGTIVIEELDTPAIRRQKSLRRKQEKLRLAAQPPLAGPGVPGAIDLPIWPPPPSGASPSRLPHKQEEPEGDSELSSLSDIGDEAAVRASALKTQPPVEDKKPIRTPAVPTTDPSTEPGAVILAEGQMLEGGTLVWAKADTYPWWPAVIYEDDDPSVPRNIFMRCMEMREKRKGVIHILQFYDKTSSWQYLPLDRLRLLGENKALDDEMVAVVSRKQKWKSSAIREDCRQAYRRALAEMETGSDLAEGEETKVQPNTLD